MTECNKYSSNPLPIDQGMLPLCELVAVYNVIKNQSKLPIDVKKFILCLDSNDSDTEEKRKYYSTEHYKKLKSENILLYIITVKYFNIHIFGSKINLPLNYSEFCFDTRDGFSFSAFSLDDALEILSQYNTQSNACSDCSLFADVSVGILRNGATAEELCEEIICKEGASTYSLPFAHLFWLRDISDENMPYDPNNIPLYDYTNPPPINDTKECTLQVYDSSGLSSRKIAELAKTIPPSVITCVENHNLQINDTILLTGSDFPAPLWTIDRASGEVSIVVSEILDPKSFIAKPNPVNINNYIADENLKFFSQNSEIYFNKKFKFKKLRGLYSHKVTIIDCEYLESENSYIFTIINSWSLNKAYMTKFKMLSAHVVAFKTSKNSDTSVVKFTLKNISRNRLRSGLHTRINVFPSKDENWNIYAPRTDLKDPCGYCKHCCGVHSYNPPLTNGEDQDSTYGNVDCLDLGYDLLSYNPMRPHLCECVCEPADSRKHNGTECVDRVGAWCTVVQCDDDKFYITGCKEGTYLEWITDNESKTAFNFIEDGTCVGSENSNYFSDIDCLVETLPDGCGESSSSSSSSSIYSS